MVGGKGGGRPDSAQGGGPNVGAIDDALAAAQEWISSRS
jgi:alanyl-tRNA synthetase